MKKIILLSVFLLTGLFLSQIIPGLLGAHYPGIKHSLDNLMFVCLAYIMINVGREFELEKKRWKSYLKDAAIAMLAAATPWIIIAFYFMYLLPATEWGNWTAWKENLLLSCFAAPTSAGILFTMLAAAGLKNAWIYQKTQVLAIFDDLGTILLLIPLQFFMIGLKWQLFIIVFIVAGLLTLGWKRLGHYTLNQSAAMIILYSIGLVFICSTIYTVSKKLFDGGIHIEVLLPAFILGIVMKTTHHHPDEDIRIEHKQHKNNITQIIRRLTHPSSATETELISDIVSYLFMFLVGINTPLFIGDLPDISEATSITASQPMFGWGVIIWHVIVVTLLSNIGKMIPVLFYRDKNILERLALSIGMFTRGEVGAGIIIIALGYNLGGPILIIALLSLVLNLVLTGAFVMIVKKLSLKVYGETASKECYI